MAAATPSFIQSPPKQAVLSPTSVRFYVKSIKHPHEQPYAPRSPRNAPHSRQNNLKHNILRPDVKQYPSNTVQIEPKRKANVKRM